MSGVRTLRGRSPDVSSRKNPRLGIKNPRLGINKNPRLGINKNPRLGINRRTAFQTARRQPLYHYQIVMGVVVSTIVKQLAVGCAQWIILYQNWAVWYSSCGKKPLHEGSFEY